MDVRQHRHFMQTNADCRFGAFIGTTAGSHLYHGTLSDGSSVILKQPNTDIPVAAQWLQLRQEYEALQSLDIEGIAKPLGLMTQETAQPVMILPHLEGEPLSGFLDRHSLDITACLRLGSQLARILAGLHDAGIAHGDLRPANLFLDSRQQQLTLLDLTQATLDKHDLAMVKGGMPGDWAYLSPEQTGRMNRTPDYRTDFYSLGIVLYRMLTGQLPFSAADPLEWVHCHIARVPPSPREVVPAIPAMVSDIVMKLMAKLPEDRYQSMHGVQADLERCLAQWQAGGQVVAFALGEQDFSAQFHIPRTLYGREREVASLRAAFDRMAARGKPVLVTVTGYSGIGKSALVHELQAPIVCERGYFLSGKFDQYLHNTPYATITQALRELIRQLLAENEPRIADWRQRIQDAVGFNGQLVVDVLPQLELLIGKQAAVPELPPVEAQNRFLRVFLQFIGVFAQHNHPLVLFLDDLQWIDAASLRLIEYLFTRSDIRYLMLIGAYRDNEVGMLHPLTAMLEAIRGSGVSMHEIRLAPLPCKELNKLVADTLHMTAAQCAPLTGLIFKRTQGNPFFFTQLLAMLQREGLLRCDTQARRWRWNLTQIQHRDLTDNVVDLMLHKLRRLPGAAQRALRLAACLGNSFTLERLALVCRTGIAELEVQLAPAAGDWLVALDAHSGKFLHDRIRQAAYSMIPPHRRAALHLGIARLLARQANQDDSTGYLFDVVNQFNRGAGLLRERREMDDVAALNLRAARKAKASTAYASACSYLAAGMALLDDDAWQRCYRLAFDLWLECAQCSFLTGQFDYAMDLLTALLQRQLPTLDMTAACHLKVLLHVAKSQIPQARDTALACLRLFGMDLPTHPTRKQIQAEYDQFRQNMRGRSIESLADMPLAADPDIRAAMRMLSALALPAAFSDMNLNFMLYCRMVNLILRHGITSESVYGCAAFEAVLTALFHRYRDAYRFARMACVIAEKNGFITEKAKVYLFTGLAAVWTQPVSTSLEFLETSFHVALETDDLAFACYSSMCQINYQFLAGTSLDKMRQTTEMKGDFARQVRFLDVANIILSHYRFTLAMQGHTLTLASFSDADFDEDKFASQLTKGGMPQVVCWHWILKLQAAWLAGDNQGALAAAAKAEPWLWATPAEIQMLSYHYFKALAIASITDEHPAPMPPSGQHMQPAWRAQLRSHAAPLREWAKSNPGTFLDKYALVSAEIARLEGNDQEAMRLYEQAIASARDNGFVHNEGIAYECASAFYRARGFSAFADTYLRHARDCFAHWGADGKVAQLEACHPELRTQLIASAMPAIGGAAQLDVLSVAKTAQAISGRIVLDELVDTLMRIVLENAGAQTGCLLLDKARNGELQLAADVDIDRQDVRVRLHLDPAAPAHALPLPASILNYVRRSRELVVLPDAAQAHSFSGDAYFALHHPKSVLCLPIVRQAVLLGVLYLENSLCTKVFTPQRLDVLELLASQAAISLENALLYAGLRRENDERRRAEQALCEARDELERRVIERTDALNESNRQLQAEIAERQQAEVVLARSNAELEQLAYVASHDLQEPLRMVSSYLTLVERRYADRLDADAHEFIGFAVDGATRMQALIDDLLNYSRVGTRAAPPRPTDCAAVVAAVLQMLRVALDESGTQVHCGHLPLVMADPGQLSQLFQNLLSNAIKFRRPGQPARLDIFAEPVDGFWRLAVRDNGIGIAPEYFERIFDMFQRLHGRRAYPGTGIGLAICKKIVEHHNGRIWVESLPEQGSTFYFTLPHVRDEGVG